MAAVPQFKNAAEERFYRHTNPNSEYTKQVDLKYVNNIGNALKNNTGVSQDQMKQYNDLTKKWNVNTQPSMNDQVTDMFNKQQQYLNDMYNKQKESQMQQLQAQRDKAIGQINQQKAQVAPQYQQMRNQTDAVNQQNVQRLREVMANAGLTASGENVSANAAMNNQRVNSLNQLNLQEQNTIDDLDRRIADLNNPAEEQAMLNAIEAERARAMYDAYNRSEDVGYGRYRDSVLDNRYQSEFDYQKGRDARRDAEWESSQKWDRGRWQEEFDYQKQRDARRDAEWESTTKDERAWRKYTYEHMSETDRQQLEYNRMVHGEDMAWKMYEMEYSGNLEQSMNQQNIDYYSAMDFLP